MRVERCCWSRNRRRDGGRARRDAVRLTIWGRGTKKPVHFLRLIRVSYHVPPCVLASLVLDSAQEPREGRSRSGAMADPNRRFAWAIAAARRGTGQQGRQPHERRPD